MSEKMRMAFIVLCLALIAGGLWFFQRGDEQESAISAPVESIETSVRETAPAVAEVDEPTVVAEESPSPEVDADYSINGQVFEDNVLVDGVVVVASVPNGPPVKATSENGGQFSLPGLRIDSDVKYTVEGDYVLVQMMQMAVVHLDDNNRSDPKDTKVMIHVARGARVSGTVVDLNGRGIDRGVVYAIRRNDMEAALVSKPDKLGQFQLSPLRAGKYDLRFSWSGAIHPIKDSTLDTVTLEQGQQMNGVRLVNDQSTEPGLKISGRVIDDLGVAIPNVTVNAVELANGTTTEGMPSDENGVFFIHRLNDAKHRVRLNSLTHVTKNVNQVAAGTTDLNVTMVRTASAEGTIVDESTGRPVQDYELTVMHREYAYTPSNDRYEQFEETDGAFTAPRINPDSRVFIWVKAEGYAEASHELSRFHAAEHRTGIRIALAKENVIRGVVVNSSGMSVPNAQIYRGNLHANLRNADRFDSVVADFEGRFELKGYSHGEYFLSAYKPTYSIAMEKVVVRSSITDVKIVLPEGASIRALITLDGEPVMAQAALDDFILDDGSVQDGSHSSGTDPFGQVEFKGLPPGMGQLRVAFKDGELERETIRLVRLGPGETLELKLEFKSPNSSIEGYLMANDTEAVTGRLELLLESSAGLEFSKTETDENGFYRFDALPVGTFKLVAAESGTQNTRIIQASLNANEHKELNVVLDSGTQLICVVENEPPDSESTGFLLPPDTVISGDFEFATILELFPQMLGQAEFKDGTATFTNVDAGEYIVVIAAMSTIGGDGTPRLADIIVSTVILDNEPERRITESY